MNLLESKIIKRTVTEKQWVLVKYAQAVVQPLGGACVLFALVVLAGYLGSIEVLYRPFTDAPATNPLTAICILFLGLVLQQKSTGEYKGWLLRVLTFLVIAITALKIFDYTMNMDLASFITPFYGQVMQDIQEGKDNSMGVNSAIMILLIAVSIQLYQFQKLTGSQFFAFIAISFPMVSFTGYAYGLNAFYGQMSAITATAGFALVFAALAMTADFGGLRAFLSPYHGGTISRMQAVGGYIFPTLLGYLLIRTLSLHDETLIGIYIVATSWFIILMVSFSAIYLEAIDQERREGERKLAKAALTDPLTGLSNRRMFIEFGELEIKRVQRTQSQFWLLTLDIDFFKKVNDTSGHEMGDKALVELSKVLQNSIRAVDLASRMGGDEFSIILVDASMEGVERVAQKILNDVSKIKIKGWTDIHGPITVSIGCATNDGSHMLGETMSLADTALYEAKKQGRNRTVILDYEPV